MSKYDSNEGCYMSGVGVGGGGGWMGANNVNRGRWLFVIPEGGAGIFLPLEVTASLYLTIVAPPCGYIPD